MTYSNVVAVRKLCSVSVLIVVNKGPVYTDMKSGAQLSHKVHQVCIACDICCGRQHLQTWCRSIIVGEICAAEWVKRGWNSGRCKRFFACLEPSGPALGPTQTSSRWVPGFFPVVKAVGS